MILGSWVAIKPPLVFVPRTSAASQGSPVSPVARRFGSSRVDDQEKAVNHRGHRVTQSKSLSSIHHPGDSVSEVPDVEVDEKADAAMAQTQV